MCDPWYFLELYIKYNDQDEDEYKENDISELSEEGYQLPDGSWVIGSNDYKIIYDGAEYDIISFNNQSKEIQFMVDKNVVKSLKMKFIHQVVSP